MRLEHISAHIEQQISSAGLIANSYHELMRVGSSLITPIRVQTRLAALHEEWQRFLLTHQSINLAIHHLNDEDRAIIQYHQYFTQDLFTTTREGYLNSVENMNMSLDSEQDTSSMMIPTYTKLQTASVSKCSHQARLPRINIPKFDGKLSDWLTFKDLFNSLVISNTNLSDVERFQYLKTSLVGTAAQLIKHTTLTADNFQKSWESLLAYYENKRLLVNSSLHSLFTLKRMTKESASELEQLYTTVNQIYRSLESLQRPVSTWDDIFVYIITQRLDSESVKTWEQFLGSSRDPPSLRQLNEFLMSRLLTLQAFERSRSGKSALPSSSLKMKTHFASKTTDADLRTTTKCIICSASHYIGFCSKFRTKSAQEKRQFIDQHQLCYNCLGKHKLSLCKVEKRCQKCARKHHTSLHSSFVKSPTEELQQPKVDLPSTSASEP